MLLGAVMRTLTVDIKDHPYPIHIGPNLLDRGDLIVPHLSQKRVAIVTNNTIAPLYLAPPSGLAYPARPFGR